MTNDQKTNDLRSFFLTFRYHSETLRSYPFSLVPPGITFCALSFEFLILFRDFAELSFCFVPPGITFCALSFLCLDTCQKKVITAWREKIDD